MSARYKSTGPFRGHQAVGGHCQCCNLLSCIPFNAVSFVAFYPLHCSMSCCNLCSIAVVPPRTYILPSTSEGRCSLGLPARPSKLDSFRTQPKNLTMQEPMLKGYPKKSTKYMYIYFEKMQVQNIQGCYLHQEKSPCGMPNADKEPIFLKFDRFRKLFTLLDFEKNKFSKSPNLHFPCVQKSGSDPKSIEHIIYQGGRRQGRSLKIQS